MRRCSYAIAYTSSVASSRLIGWAGRVGEVGCSRCGVGLRDGFADVAVGLPVRLLAVAVAVVRDLAARAAAACGFTRACCASCCMLVRRRHHDVWNECSGAKVPGHESGRDNCGIKWRGACALMQRSESRPVPASRHMETEDRSSNLRLLVKEPFKLSVLAMGRREWNSSGRLKAGSGDVDAGGVACDATEPSEDRLGMSNRHVRMHRNTDFELYNCNFEESEHTTLRAVSPVHYGMSTIVHRSIAIAKTGRKHIQTHASGWHFLFSFCFATSFPFCNRSRQSL